MRYDPDLILTTDNHQAVIDHLVAHGHPAPSLAIATNVQLANLYHMTAPSHSATDIQLATARAVCAALASVAGYVTPPPVRSAPSAALSHYRTELVIRIATIGHAIMLVGPAGCGKTTIGEHTAKALDLPFYITSTINDTHELLGFVDGHGCYHGTAFRTAYENGGVWVADEIDAWDASALLAANSALANGFCTFPDAPSPITRHADFRMIATANTFGTGPDRVYVGRNELDAASLDRFATIDVDYDLDLERMFANGSDRWLERVWNVRKIVDEKKIRHVVSSRAIAMGATALAAGISWDDCQEIYLFKGMNNKDRAKINA